jgi:hypothetical protein
MHRTARHPGCSCIHTPAATVSQFSAQAQQLLIIDLAQHAAHTLQVLDGWHSWPDEGAMGISTVASGITQEQFLIPVVQRGSQEGMGNEGTFCETFHK